jgi:hypothetical protein
VCGLFCGVLSEVLLCTVIVVHLFNISADAEMAIFNLETEEGIKSLDAFLADRSYVEG